MSDANTAAAPAAEPADEPLYEEVHLGYEVEIGRVKYFTGRKYTVDAATKALLGDAVLPKDIAF